MSTIGNQALPFDPSRSSGKPRDAQRFNGDGATLTFTLSLAVDSAVDIDVYVDNISQEPLTAYDVNGASITFTEAPPVGTNNVRVIYRNYQTGISTSVADGSISYQKLANNIRLFTTDNFTGDNTTVAFALTTAPADANTVFVSVDGIVQRAPIHYTTSGTTITFTSAPPTSSNVHVRHLGFRTTSTVTALSANTTITQPVLASPSFTGTVQTGAAFTGNLSATGTLSTTGGAAIAEAAASQAKSVLGSFNSGAAAAASAEMLTFAQAGTQKISHFWANNTLAYQLQTLAAGAKIQLMPDTGGTVVANVSSTGLAVTGLISATTTVAGSGGASTLSVPTRQVFLSGTAATYTTPANCRRIVVRMKGPGGSTHGSSTSADGGAAGAGTATSFNSITAAVGGNSGQSAGGKASGGSGGTGGTGTASLRIAGAMGHAQTTPYATGTNVYLLGGNGAGTGGGYSKDPSAYGNASGSAGVANSGGGASGAGLTTSLAFASASGGWTSGGGGEGEYAEITISSPAATYTYTVGTAGAGGTAGTNGVAGAAGGSGFIYVDEYY